MEQLIPLVNKLQDAFGAVGLQFVDLPQIVVVGSQSSGKSSVLESLVGKDFLPRGTGIVTRRPLVLQLYNIPATRQVDGQEQPNEEYGEFLHLPGKRFFDFSDIRTEIIRETDRLTGKNKGISNKTINLRIYSPHVLNLTLVDLPGITKVPTGDQPEDVEDQIRKMCLEFILNKNAIILAVSAANQDLANSDGIKLARTVDPDGERTIGVLTKVDIMDHGTDCGDVLSNKVIPLRRGYIAVVNRSQRDIDASVPVRNGLSAEMNFFQSHSKYRDMLSKCGTANLALMLNKMLIQHIRNCLPEIKSTIANSLKSYQNHLLELGETLGESGYKQLFLRIISDFSNNVAVAAEGNTGSDEIPMELCGGARISYIFNESFGRTLQKVSGIDGLDDNIIRIAIANTYGSRPFLFIPEKSFYDLVRKQIERLEEPGLQCAEQVFDEMSRLAEAAITNEMRRFPVLKERVMDVVRSLLASCMQPTRAMISNIINVEKAYINITHPDFIGGKQAVAQAQERIKQARQMQNSSAAAEGESAKTIIPGFSGSNENLPALGSEDAVKEGVRKLTPTSVSSTPPNYGTVVNANNLNREEQGLGSRPIMDLFRSNKSSAAAPQQGIPAAVPSAGNASILRPPPVRFDGRAESAMVASSNDFSRSSDDAKELRLPSIPDHIRFMPNPTDKERIETEIIKILIDSYFGVVKKTFIDMVPKIIIHFLLDAFKKDLHNRLVTQLYSENLARDLMRESDDIAEQRRNCETMKSILSRAMNVLNEARDFNIYDK